MDLSIEIPHLYTPRSYQREVFEAFNKGIRRFILVWHRRSGKDKTMLNFMICRMMERRGMYWYVLPTYKQAKTIIWEGMGSGVKEGMPFMDHFPEELVEKKNETDLSVTLVNGSIFKLVGSDNIDRVVGANPVGIVYSEYALQSSSAWEFVSPMLVENKGWSAFIFTPRSRNHAYSLWNNAQDKKSWWTSIKTISDTKRDADDEDGSSVITEEALEEERIRGAEEDFIQQEYYCSFTGYREGSYYGKWIADLYKSGRIGDHSWDPKYQVFTGWDLGIADQCAIWFAQKVGREIFLIDYYQNTAQGLPHYIKICRDKPYTYSTHYAPHDIEVREFTSGRTRREVARDLGIYFKAVPKLSITEGIDYVRTILPRAHFDKTKCDLGIRSLINYHKEYNRKTEDYNWHPVHDIWSHGADAFRYLCYGIDNEGLELTQVTEYQREFDIFKENEQIKRVDTKQTEYQNQFDIWNHNFAGWN